MSIFPSLRKPRQKINLLIAALFVAVQLPLLLILSPVQVQADNHMVEICHATSSTSNPYSHTMPATRQEVAKQSVVTAHGDHEGPVFPATNEEGNWGDIIPPFEGYDGRGASGWEAYPGMNWTAEGQAIWNNNCAIPTGTITIIKDVHPDRDEKVFEFTTTGTGVSGFNLDDNAETELSDQKIFNSGLSAGVYSFTELVAVGWRVSSSCTGTTATSTTTESGHKVEFTLGSTNVVCTFVNTKQSQTRLPETGSITIVKDAQPNDIADFVFSATGIDGVANLTLDDDGDNTNTYKDSVTYDDLEAGEYSFTEQATAGWTLSAINCTPATGVVVAIPKVTITLGEGDDVTCTFVNTKNVVNGVVLGDSDEVVTTGGQGGGAVLGAQTEAPVGGVSAGYGASRSIASSLVGLGTSLSALGYGVASLRKRQ